MQLGKILAAGSLAALMAGSTIAFAATLSDYPQPFIKSDGTADFLVAVGATADPADIVGAIDTATRLGGESTTDYTCTGSSGGVTVTGEGKALATVNTKLYVDDALKKDGARYTFTNTDLPVLLKGGTVSDTDASDTYNYNQYIDFSSNYSINYTTVVGSSGVQTDPALVIRPVTGTNPTNPAAGDYMYRTRIVFEKLVNTSTARGEKISLFGTDYTISSDTSQTMAGTTADEFVLFGSAQTKVFTGGQTVTVTVGGVNYDVTLSGASADTTAVVNVGGSQDSITEGQTKTIGGLKVYAEKVWRFSTTDQTQNQAKLGLGAEELVFKDSSRVYTNRASPSYIDGTYADLIVSGGKLSGINLYVALPKSTMNMKVGETFTDPIFKTFKVAYPSATPGLTDSARTVIDVLASGDNDLTLKTQNEAGKEATIYWSHQDSTEKTFPQDNSGNWYVLKENDPVFLNQYITLDAGDFSHLLKLSGMNVDGTSSGYVQFTDVFTSTVYSVILGTTNTTTWYLDGQAYYINASKRTDVPTVNNITITWGDGAGLTTVGNELTVWPKMKLKGGAYMAIMNQSIIPVANGVRLVFPTGVVTPTIYTERNGTVMMNLTAYTGSTATYTAAWNIDPNNATEGNAGLSRSLLLGKSSTGGFYYNLSKGPTNATLTVTAAGATSAVRPTAGNAEVSVIVIEEQEKAGDVYSIWFNATAETSGSVVQAAVGVPAFTYTRTVGTALLSSGNTYKTQYVDLYGTFAERDTYQQDKLKIYYPDEQMTNDVYVLGKDATISTTAAVAGASVKQVSPIKTSVAKLDKDIGDTEKNTKNLILVGGPCANTLVRTLLNSTLSTCVSDFEGKGYTAGSAMIKLVNDAFVAGKSALIVAGYNAADTVKACGILQSYDSYSLTGTEAKVVDTTVTQVA